MNSLILEYLCNQHTKRKVVIGVTEINGENPVTIGYMVSEKYAQKSVHRIIAYTVVNSAFTA